MPASRLSNSAGWLQMLLARAALTVLTAIGAGAAGEHPRLHSLFCDHAVLQRGVAVPVWGGSEPGASISVGFADQTRTTVTGKNGRWLLKLKSLRTCAESCGLRVSYPATHASADINDVFVGDVWLCCGQPKMEMGVAACDATNGKMTPSTPLIHVLMVPRGVDMEPVEKVSVRWLLCSPDRVKQTCPPRPSAWTTGC